MLHLVMQDAWNAGVWGFEREFSCIQWVNEIYCNF